jgi:hypothetical protein
MATPMHHPSRGVTTPCASFVCAVTQFLSSADLRHLNQVCHTDHLALDSLWNTCATKCKGQLPVLELRSADSNPRDTAYLWSVAHAVVTRWTETLRQAAYVVQSFMLQSHGCLHCDTDRYLYHNSEYVITVAGKGKPIQHDVGTSGEIQRTCKHLQQIWLDATGVPIQQPGVRAQQFGAAARSVPTTLLHVLIRLGPQIDCCFISPIGECMDPFVEMWMALGVMPRIRIDASMVASETREELVLNWPTVFEFIDRD